MSQVECIFSAVIDHTLHNYFLENAYITNIVWPKNWLDMFCILALDVQNCGMGREGGEALRTLVDTNQTLEVVDLRRNPFVPENLPQQLVTMLEHRHNQYSQQVFPEV